LRPATLATLEIKITTIAETQRMMIIFFCWRNRKGKGKKRNMIIVNLHDDKFEPKANNDASK